MENGVPGLMAWACDSSTADTEAGGPWQFCGQLVSMVSSRPARAIQKSPIQKQEQQRKTKEEHLNTFYRNKKISSTHYKGRKRKGEGWEERD